MRSSPGVVNPTDSPPIPGTPHSGARSLPRTPASGVSRTPGSAARSGPGGRRSQSVQPSPNRSDLGRGSSQVRAAVGSQGEEAGSGNNANTQIWGTDIHVSETQAAVKRFFLEFTPEGRDEPLYEQLLHQAYANSQYWINLDCGHLRSFDSSLYEKLIRFPTEAITILDVVLTELYTEMFQNRSDFQEVSIVSRPFNLEDSVVMRNLNPSDVDKLVSIKGMVIRRYVHARA
jgi:DNA replication licensing factor MCM4